MNGHLRTQRSSREEQPHSQHDDARMRHRPARRPRRPRRARGWSLSQGTTIICSCGERLFKLADLKAAEVAENLSTFVTGPNVLVGGYQAAAGNLNVQLLVRNIAFQKKVASSTRRTTGLPAAAPSVSTRRPSRQPARRINPAPNCGTRSGRGGLNRSVRGFLYCRRSHPLGLQLRPQLLIRAPQRSSRDEHSYPQHDDARMRHRPARRPRRPRRARRVVAEPGHNDFCLCGERLFELDDLKAAA